ncbi:MAG: hypothetical protein ABI790_11360 [Betaproteobacteria bacterium]
MIDHDKTPDANTAIHLALKAALAAIQKMAAAVVPLLDPKVAGALEKRLVEGGMMTLVINNDGMTVTAALATSGAAPDDNRILYKAEAPIASVLAPAGSVPVIEPRKMN